VTRIAPLVCERVVGQGARVERWRKIAMAAAKQSGRTALTVVDPPRPIAALLRDPWSGLRLLAWEGERERPLTALPGEAAAVVVVVGPEGGFTDAEVADAGAHGFTPVTLAPRVLRAETAAIVAVALCQHRFGDLSSARPVG
jgi:16S rRNA (uracil1498-N3)-methyltransferase